MSENEQKKHSFVYSSKVVDMQKLVNSLKGYLEIVLFRLILNFFKRFLLGFDWFRSFFINLCLKKCFNQLFGARSTQKLVEIHNSQVNVTKSPLT